MATTKFALKLYQDRLGDVDALVKISVNGSVVADSVAVPSTDSASPNIFTYEVDGIADPSDSTTADITVELLNDEFIDSDNDRNVHIDAVGYLPKRNDGYWQGPYKAGVGDSLDGTTEIAKTADEVNTHEGATYTVWKVKPTSDVIWQISPVATTGDAQGEIDADAGWPSYTVSTSSVTMTLPIKSWWVAK